ncbi:MAG: PHP domain-containing protein [Candidatus Cloacimonetes bacterium]|nr:PHP domain-containing protein [Candidatus Cloacimonadota bacterium]
MKKIDLHIHTNGSDGLYSAQEVLELAHHNKYNVISITDHDTLDGYNEALKYIGDYDIELIPGVEISCIHNNQDVHMLAYNFDPKDEKLGSLLNSIHQGRFVRAKKILQKLQNMGIDLPFEKIEELAGENGLIGRPHIARALIEMKYCNTIKEVFDIYLGEKCPAYEPKPAPSTKKAIKMVKKAGGVTVLAHPFTLGNDALIYELINIGIDGIEVFYTKHSDEKVDFYNEIALKNNLIRTGGSDFHGDGFDLQNFGFYSAPEFVYDELMNGKNLADPF